MEATDGQPGAGENPWADGLSGPDGATVAEPTGRRRQVLQVVRSAPQPLRIAQVADALGMHTNTARFHLEALAADGLLDRVTGQSDGPGRPPLRFGVKAGMDPTGPRHYRQLATVLAEAIAALPDPGGAAAAAGSDWGRRLVAELTEVGSGPAGSPSVEAQLTSLLQLLDGLGFDPYLFQGAGRRSDSRVGLRRCPFLEVAQQRPVVCTLHLGLMRGASTAIGSGVVVRDLVPFAAPDLCVAHLKVRR